jgi:hypothetical protein
VRYTWQQLAFKAAIGVLLFALANVLVFYSSGFFQRERHYHQTVTALVNRPEVSVVLLGDSHVAEIPAELLDQGVHNLAAGGDGYREGYAKLRYLFSKPHHVKTLLLTADYHMFGAGRVQSSNRSFVERYLLATGSDIGYEKNRLSSLFNLVPLFNDDFVQYFKKDVRQKLRRTRDRVHAPAQPWPELSAEVRQQRALETGRGDHAGVGAFKEPIDWFERILKLAQQHGIEVIAVRYPTSAGYLAQVPEGGKKIVDAELARVGAPAVIDLGHAFADPGYFADEDHVNGRGAAALLCLLEERTHLDLTQEHARQECSISAKQGSVAGGAP